MPRKIGEMMHKGELATLAPEATVYEAACLMKARTCGSVLVVVEGKLRGIFTERDVVNRVVATKLDPMTTPLARVMTEKPDTVRPDTLSLEALRMMEDGGYRHLPVVSRGQLLGIVSRRDFYGEEKAAVEKERHIWERLG